MPSLFELDINAIRTGVFGKDVREAIADGLERCYSQSTANGQIAQIVAKGEEIRNGLNSDYPDYTEMAEILNNFEQRLIDRRDTFFGFADDVMPSIKMANDFIIDSYYLASVGFGSVSGYARSRFPYPPGKYILGPMSPGFVAVEYISDSQGSALINNWVANATIVATRPFYISFNAVSSSEILNAINTNFSVVRVLNETGSTIKDKLDSIVITENSENIFDGTFIDGEQVATSTGAFISGNGYSRTGYIPVKQGTVHIGVTGPSSVPSFVFIHCAIYDVTKTKLDAFSYQAVNVTTAGDMYVQTINAQQDGFIAFDIYTASLGAYSYYVSQVSSPQRFVSYREPVSKIHPKYLYSNGPHKATKQTLSNGQTLVVESNSIIKNQEIKFFGKVYSFNKIEIGHGLGDYSAHVEIDGTNISYIVNGSLLYHEPHNLTISEYLYASVSISHTGGITVTVSTMDGSVMSSPATVTWLGRKGEIYAKPTNCTFTETSLVWDSKDYTKPVWVFGDSYLAINSTARWPYWVVTNWGYDTMLLNGYPGEASENAYNDLITALTHNTPKYILWCIGMNDHDSQNSVNSTWQTVVESIMTLCNQKGITLILSTTPNVLNTSYNNLHKNEYVVSSGYRYVDFAGVVDGVSDWLSSDRAHPNAKGARLLAVKAIMDFPELIQEN